MLFDQNDYDLIAEKLNKFMDLIRETHFPFIRNLTISIGMSRISPYDFPITVLENADKALYYAKEHGRDQICFYEALIDEDLIETNQEGNDIDLF